MLILDKHIVAEIILNTIYNKTNKEIVSFIEDFCSGSDFEFLYTRNTTGLPEKYISDFFDMLVNELRVRNSVFSYEELQALYEQLSDKGKTISDRLKHDINTIINKDFSCYDVETVLKQSIKEAVKYAKMYLTVLSTMDDNDESTSDYCSRTFSAMAKINNIDYKKRETQISLDQFDDIMDIINDAEQECLSTGFKSLDNLLVGGIPKDDTYLFLLMAPSGVGKSMFMLNLADKMIKANQSNVLIISLEMSCRIYAKRYITLTTSVPFSELKKQAKKVESKFKVESRINGKKLQIIEFPTSQATVLDIENKINELKAKGWSPDVVIVDYLTIMKPLNKVSSNKGYESGITLAEELRGLSGKLKIPFISAIQSNRNENFNNSKVDVSNVSESYGIVSTCDFLGALYQSEADKLDGRLYFKTLKNRNGNCSTILYSVDYSTIKISELTQQ